MTEPNPPTRLKTQQYDSWSKFFHWSIALGIIGLLAIGFIMIDLTAPLKYSVYNYHKLTGLAVLALVVMRLAYRIYQKFCPTLSSWRYGSSTWPESITDCYISQCW